MDHAKPFPTDQSFAVVHGRDDGSDLAPPPYARRAAEDRALLQFIRSALGDLRRELGRTDLLQGVRMADTIAKTCIDKINNQR